MAALSLAFDVVANDRNAARTFNNVGDAADRAGRRGAAFGNAMKAGIGIAVGALATLGLGAAFRTFIDEANEAAKVGRLTDAVIASTGAVANISAQQVGDLAEALSNKVAVDDELIQSGANVLLTFTKVRNEVGEGNDIFNQATLAALNMSAALGTDMQAASIQLGKALNDPIKGVTALSKAGVSFTQQQKDQIKAMVEAGDTLGAQKLILAEMETQFAGAAEAVANPLDRLRVVAGNLGEAIGGALLPYVNDFATYVSDTVLPVVKGFIDQFVAGEGAGGKFKDGLIGLKDAALGVYDAIMLAKGGIENVVALIRDRNAKPLGEALGLDAQTVADMVKIRDAVAEFANVIATNLKPVWDTLVFAWRNDLKPAFDELFTVLKDELGPLIGGPTTTSFAQFVGVLISKAVPTIIVTAKVIADLIRVVASLIGPLISAWMAAAEFGRQVSVMGMRVQLAMSQTVGAVRSLPGLVTAALRGAGNALVDAGRDLVGGLIRGITDRAGSAVQAIRETVSRMVAAAKSLLQIQSPSKVFEGIGINTVDGLTKGLEKTSGLDAAMNSLMTKVSMPSTSPTASATPGAGGTMVFKVELDGKVLTEVVTDHQGRQLESVH